MVGVFFACWVTGNGGTFVELQVLSYAYYCGADAPCENFEEIIASRVMLCGHIEVVVVAPVKNYVLERTFGVFLFRSCFHYLVIVSPRPRSGRIKSLPHCDVL